MNAVIKSIWSGDPDIDLKSYTPNNPLQFGVWVNFVVGPSDEEGGHDFQILVCSPAWFELEELENGCSYGRHVLFLLEWDYIRVATMLEKMVSGFSGGTFWEVATKISRYAAWEFEDYTPSVN